MSDGLAGKRLAPALLANLDRHGYPVGIDPQVVAQVLAMSPAAIDWPLEPAGMGWWPASRSATPGPARC